MSLFTWSYAAPYNHEVMLDLSRASSSIDDDVDRCHQTGQRLEKAMKKVPTQLLWNQ